MGLSSSLFFMAEGEEMQSERDIAIWFSNGATAYFHDVRKVRESEGELTFGYVSASTGQRRFAKFDLLSVSGWSITLNEESSNG